MAQPVPEHWQQCSPQRRAQLRARAPPPNPGTKGGFRSDMGRPKSEDPVSKPTKTLTHTHTKKPNKKTNKKTQPNPYQARVKTM